MMNKCWMCVNASNQTMLTELVALESCRGYYKCPTVYRIN